MARGKKQPGFAVRGVMLDPARHIERRAFYFDLLPRLAEWGFNTLWWHFVDNEGVALKLDSHPEVAAPHAFSKPEMKRLLGVAAEAGIDVVPEVETLGHARYLTDLPQYAHLRDGTHRVMNAICPSHPETLGIMEDIIREVADLFPGPYLHAGLDEADFSGCKRCTRRGRGKPGWWVYAEHVKAIHRIVTDCGKRMVMWADHVEHDPELLKALPRDVILCHWQYRKVDEAAIRRSLDAGFQVITAPTMCSFRDMIQPGAHNLRTMDALTEATAGMVDRGALGVVNTWWAPQRGLRDAYVPALAYTGRLLSRGASVGKPRFFRTFARDFFGIDAADVGRALWHMHELIVNLGELDALLCYSLAGLHRLVNWAATEEYAARAEQVAQHAATLASAATKARRNADVLGASALAAELVHTCMANGERIRLAGEAYEAASVKAGGGWAVEDMASDLTRAADLIDGAASSMAVLHGKVADEWARTRYPRYPAWYVDRESVRALDRQMLLGRVRMCRDFMGGLSRGFRRDVKAFRAGGPFPGGV